MEENGLSTKWNLQQTRLLCWGKWSSHRQHCWPRRWTHLLSWILQCFSLHFTKADMPEGYHEGSLEKRLDPCELCTWNTSDVNVPVSILKILTVQPYHAYFESWPSCSSGLVPGAVLPLARVASHSESSAEAGPHAEAQGSSEQSFLRSPPTQVGERNSLWQHKSLSMVEKTFAYPLYSTQCLVMTNVMELNQ